MTPRATTAVRRARAVAAGALLGLGGATTGSAHAAGVPTGGDSEPVVRARIDATFTYGIGGWSALGGQLRALAQASVWNTTGATGSFDAGLVLGAQGEPQWLQYGVPRGLANDAQRLHTWGTVGHTFHLGHERRSALGLHVFGGWTHVFSQAEATDSSLGLARRVTDDYGELNLGGSVEYSYRASDFVGFTLQAVAPFPLAPSYVNTLFHVGVGVVAFVR